MIYTLLVTLIIFLIISYYFFDRKIISPPVVLNAVYVFSTICAIYNVKKWGIDLHANTYCVITGGNLIFMAISYIIHLYYKKKHLNKNQEDYKTIGLKYIELSYSKIIIYTLIVCVFSIIYGYSILKLAKGYNNTNDYAELMTAYRRNTSYGEDSLPAWLMRLFLIISASIYMITYVFVNNIICNKKKKKNYILLIPIVIFLVATLMGAERADCLNLFVYILTISYLLLSKKENTIRKINNKYVKRGVVAVSLFLILFSVSKGLVGRTDDYDTMYYITFYAGGSIQLLDMFLQDPTYPTYIGEEVFRGFRNKLSKYGIVENTSKIGHLEFRHSHRVNIGNVYTAYRKYIHDFGYFSIIPFQLCLAVFYGIWYEKIKYRKIRDNIDISVILFVYMFIPLVKHSIQEGFYSTYLVNLPIIFIYMIIWKYYFVDFKLKYGNKKILN